MGEGESAWEGWDDAGRSKETVAARLFSSGTTGLPKAVEMTHYNFVAQHTLVMEYKPKDYEVRGHDTGWMKSVIAKWMTGRKAAMYTHVPCQ